MVNQDARNVPNQAFSLPNFTIDGTTNELHFFLLLWPIAIPTLAVWCNEAAVNANVAGFTHVTDAEMYIFLGLFILRSLVPDGSRRSLWKSSTDSDGRVLWGPPDFSQWMSRNRFDHILRFFSVHAPNAFDATDPWYMVRPLIDAFNANRREVVFAGWLLVVDELMSAYQGQNMPHLSYVIRKPEPLGCEMKCLCCGVSGIMLFLEIQEGKQRMANKPYVHELAATAACTKRMVVGGGFTGTSRVVLGDSWFASFKTARALREIGVYFIGLVKTATRNFPMHALRTLVATADAHRGDHAVMQTEINGDRYIAVGWMRSNKRPNCYIASCGVTLPAAKRACVKRHDQHGNVENFEFDRPSLVQTYSSACGLIDNHNMLRQGILKLEKKWVTQQWWIRVITTVIGICVTDAWLAFKKVIPGASDESVPFLDFVHSLAYELVQKGLQLRCDLTHSHHRGTAPHVAATVAGSNGAQDMNGDVHKIEHTDLRKKKSNGFSVYKQMYCRYCAVIHGKGQVKTTWKCGRCNIALCDEVKTGRPCFRAHVAMNAGDLGKLKQRKSRKSKG